MLLSVPKKAYKTSSKSGFKKKLGALITLLIALPLILFQVKVVQDLRNRAASESLPPGVERRIIDGKAYYAHQDSSEPFALQDMPISRIVPKVGCVGDGASGPRFQVVYAYKEGTPNRISAVREQILTTIDQASELFDLSAQQTGGRREPRFVTNGCEVDIQAVALPGEAFDDFWVLNDTMRKMGFSGTYRNAVVFMEPEVPGMCGYAMVGPDSQPGVRNRSNIGGATARIAYREGCWKPGLVAHEMMHTIGAVQADAPNASRYYHCVDEYDLMCYQDADGVVMHVACSDKELGQARFDCNGDDYFSFKPTGYLASHWNAANSVFLDDPTRDAAVEISGGSGKRGEEITLAIHDFQPNETFVIRWNPKEASGLNKDKTDILETASDGNGIWSGSIAVPTGAKTGENTIVVRGAKGSYAEVSINVIGSNKKNTKKKKSDSKKKSNKKNKN